MSFDLCKHYRKIQLKQLTSLSLQLILQDENINIFSNSSIYCFATSLITILCDRSLQFPFLLTETFSFDESSSFYPSLQPPVIMFLFCSTHWQRKSNIHRYTHAFNRIVCSTRKEDVLLSVETEETIVKYNKPGIEKQMLHFHSSLLFYDRLAWNFLCSQVGP